jgi:hypothetical protein
MNRWLKDENAHNVADIMISFLTWSSMYLAIYSRKTSVRIIKIAPETLRLKRQELAVKITSIIHAAYTAWGAHIALIENPILDLYSHSESGLYYANVTAGFFIADLILCIILIDEHGIQFLIHAIVALISSVYVSMTKFGLQYFLHLLLFESSTPFLHIRTILYEYGYGNTLIAKINNLILLLTFGYFRLYKGIPVLINLCHTLIVYKPLSLPTTTFFIFASISMTSLNIFWFYKMLKSVIKIIKNYRTVPSIQSIKN